MPKLILLSFTPIDAPGGVPRWNRDLMAAFPEGIVEHYSWWDVLTAGNRDDSDVPEWDKALVLASWLQMSKKVSRDDVIVGDGFWADGFKSMGFPNVVSVAHGIWSHLTKEDVEAGKQPEFPLHHARQVEFRRRFLGQGGKIVAVSEFIRDSMHAQWGFGPVPVINNGVDMEEWNPKKALMPWEDGRLIIHGVTTTNKGFDHIAAVKTTFPNDRVMLLDEAASKLKMAKQQALASADVVVFPSAHEGNSYFFMEALACGAPVVAYDVGYAYELKRLIKSALAGVVLDRRSRSPGATVDGIRTLEKCPASSFDPRSVAVPVERFRSEWREYLKLEFGFEP